MPARDFDKTGNVRLISDDGAAAAARRGVVRSSTPAPSVAPADVTPSAGEVAGRAPANPLAEREESAPPPWPNYDELSIASLRARLRSLDVAKLRQLTEYERAHAGRPDVIAMFERRIVKLEAEAGPEARA